MTRALRYVIAAAILSTSFVDAQISQRTYNYDGRGNRTTATGQVRFTGTDSFAIQPRRALIGELVNVLGRNFPAGQTGTVTVSFGGANATVLAVAANVITVEVPNGAATGQVTVSIGGGTPQVVGTAVVQGVVLTPQSVQLDYGQTFQFSASVVGGPVGVDWSVEGIPGGNSQVGTITAGGLYTAPPATSPRDFPFLVRATSSSLGISGYAVVQPTCIDKGGLANRALVGDSFTAAFERHCYSFPGLALQRAYIACAASSPIKALTLRRSNGQTLAVASPGTVLRLGDYELAEDDTYIIDVLNDATAGATYQIWRDVHAPHPNGRWMFPLSSNWEEPLNWSNGTVPEFDEAVVIPDFADPLTVSVTQGTSRCATVTSDEAVSLTGGILDVDGNVQVNAAFVVAGGTLRNATVVPGAGGEALQISPNSSNRLERVTVQGDLDLLDNGDRVRVAGGLTVQGTIRLAGNRASIGFEGTQTLTATRVEFSTDALMQYLEMQSGGTLTLAAGTEVRGGTGTIGGSWYWGRPMSIDNRGTIRSDTNGRTLTIGGSGNRNSGTLSVSQGAILNAGGMTGNVGTVTIADAGSALILNGTDYVLDAGLTVPAATTATMNGSWSNTGTVVVNGGGVVNFGGTFRTAGIGSFTNNGGIVNITGSLNNTNSTLMLSGTTGTWNLAGGQIVGGTVTQTGGARIGILSNSSNRLDGVVVQGDLELSTTSARVRIAGDLDVSGVVSMSGSRCSLGFEGDQAIRNGTIVFSNDANQKYLEMQSPGTLTIDPGVVIRGANGNIGNGWFWGQQMTLVHRGSISADETARTITVGATSTDNQGVLDARLGATLNVTAATGNLGTVALADTGTSLTVGGSYAVDQALTVPSGATATLGGAWSNTGPGLTVNAGTLNLGGSFATAGIGTFTNNGGVVNITGALDNSGSTLMLTGTTGTWNLIGGSITGGTLTQAGSAMLSVLGSSNNRLDGVSIQGDLDLSASSARVRVANDLDVSGTVMLTGSRASIGFEGDQAIVSGTIVFGGGGQQNYLEMQTAGTLTIAPGVVVRGENGNVGNGWYWNRAMALVNQGTISADVAARTINVGAATTSNQGTLDARVGATLNVTGAIGNLGTVLLADADTSLTVGGSYAVDQALVVPSGAAATLNGNWSNTGPGLTVNAGTLNLGGSFTTAGIGAFTNNGGVVNITGALDNSGSTLMLTGATGTWNLIGGSITGGTLTQAGGAVLSVLGNSNNRLDGVSIQGDLDLAATSARVRIANDLDVSGTVTLSGIRASIGFEGSQAITNGTIVFGGGVQQNYLEMQTAGTLTIAPGVVVRGENGNVGNGWYWNRAMTLVNQGTISADVAARSINVGAASTSNQGTLDARAGAALNVTAAAGGLGNVTLADANTSLTVGGSYAVDQALVVPSGATVTLNGSWTNTGPGLTLNAGTLNLGGVFATAGVGTFVNNGGTVNITGALDNSGSTLMLTGATGTWNLIGGSITGGTLTQAGGAALAVLANSNNRLDGVSIQGDLDLSATSARVRIANDLDVSGTVDLSGIRCSLGFEGDQTIRNGTILFANNTNTKYLEMHTAGTLTVDPGVVIRGASGSVGGSWYWGRAMTLVNRGTISADVAARPITVAAASTTNQGTFEATGGSSLIVNAPLVQTAGTTRLDASTLTASNGVDLQGGVLTGDGTLNASLTNAAEVRPGLNGTGTLTVTGNYVQTGAGTLTVELGGTAPGTFDVLAVGLDSALAGTLAIQLSGGFAPALNDAFDVVTWTSNARTTFTSLTGTSVGGGLTLTPAYGASRLTLTAQ